ncbi:MAG: hypothetical protein IJO62_05165 [Clostridia bacterium]|nr:hypothetical protein [Clostridia bacterium]
MNNIDPRLLNTKDPKKLMSSLSDKEKETVNKMLADKEALAQMLNSPEAKAILKMLSGKGNNG